MDKCAVSLNCVDILSSDQLVSNRRLDGQLRQAVLKWSVSTGAGFFGLVILGACRMAKDDQHKVGRP